MMSRVSRVILMVAMLCVALGATAVAASAKPAGAPGKHGGKPTKSKGAAGALDTSFGKGGKAAEAFPVENAGATGPKYELPFEFTPGHLEMANAPGGKVVVAGATKAVRYLANGKLDKSFGGDGSITVPRPPGAVFVLASVAVDSQGRLVLAGLARPLPSNTTPDPLLSSAVVMRFNADGTLDASFGNGGMVVTDFGLGAPKEGEGAYLGASVGLRDVVIDSANRPVLSGAYVTEIGTSERSAVSKGFLARLTETGALDQSFGENGLRTISTLTSLGQLAAESGGYLTLAERNERPHDLLTELDANGNLDTGFASFGFRSLAFEEVPTLAIAPSGKILLLGHPEYHRAYRHTKVKNEKTGEIEFKKVRYYIKKQVVQRLLPSGAGDPSFGHSGSVTFTDPKAGSYAAITADKSERVYLAGRLAKGSSKAKKGPHRTEFLLGRLQAGGGTDMAFGKGGTVATDFGRSASSFATQVALDGKGRILVGGGIVSPELETGGGFAIARYLPGS